MVYNINKVIEINSGIDITPGIVNEKTVEALEEALEQARSGEIVGVSIIKRHPDSLTSYHIAGISGGYSMVGAANCVMLELTRVAIGDYD